MKMMASSTDWTVGGALSTHSELSGVSDSPLLDCQLILAHTLGVSRSWLYAHVNDPLTAEARCRFTAMMSRRKDAVPVAYITGRRWFWNMDLKVSEATLVPRPETELLVETLLARIDGRDNTILDAGTGTGAIALALARERPAWKIFAVEHSIEAIAIAASNVRRWSEGRVGLINGDWLDAFASKSLDAVVCNPPYIREGDVHLDRLSHEPCAALVSGPDGLADIGEVIAGAARCLCPGGLLVMEHGFDQAETTRALAHSAGFTAIDTLFDLSAQPRALVAVKSI